MPRGCCATVTNSSGGTHFFVDAIGFPQDAEGVSCAPEDAVQLLYDGVTYVLLPGDVFVALIDGENPGNVMTGVWVVPL